MDSPILWLPFLLLILSLNIFFRAEAGFGCNWGLRSTHPLSPKIVVKLLRDNGFDKVKLFEADPGALTALGYSGIEVMVGIPNDMLGSLASSVEAAEAWVAQNVSSYVSKYGVDIRYVAVGNEPFLKTYKDMFTKTTLPALENVQAALIKAGLGSKVKVTVPLNADVYQSENGLPSGGNFRSDISALMISIVKFLSQNNAPITINTYPFLSLYDDPNFPIDYAFFSGTSSPIIDGSISYTNVFDANFDTLIWALEKNGYSSMKVIVGEVGWPSDGNINANIEYARKFNQGLFDRIIQGQGTPKRKTLSDIYVFSLIDEDDKSIQPGNFERHWGMLYFDGSLKYDLKFGDNRTLVPAKGVRYMPRKWCVMSPSASLLDPNLQGSIEYACTYADCTTLGYGSSCGGLDARSNASYAFNKYFQRYDQRNGACGFPNNLSVLTSIDPSQGSCRFEIMVDILKHEQGTRPKSPSSHSSEMKSKNVAFLFVFASALIFFSSR